MLKGQQMKKNHIILLELLRNELWGEKVNVDANQQELEEVMRDAKEQTVFGLAFNALTVVGIPMERKWMLQQIARFNKIRTKNDIVNREMLGFLALMDANKIDYMVMKGQTMAVLYPHPDVRTSGDVDFLVKEDYQEIQQKFNSCFGIVLPDKSRYDKDTAFRRNGVVYELHTYLITFGSSRNAKYWNKLIERSWNERCYVDVQGLKVRILPPTIYAVYVFLHLFFHFLREGVGLRQFCDWAVMLHHYSNEIDVATVGQILSELDMLKAYKAFGSVVVHTLGLPPDKFPYCLDQKDRKWGEKIVDDVMKGGNFGKNNHTVKHVGLKFKLETASVAFRNIFTYYPLAPRDIRNYFSRLIVGNIALYFEGIKTKFWKK